ncbi:MAG: beta-ketoacyl synthase N-terminal-like domain-containing protein [bacterium]
MSIGTEREGATVRGDVAIIGMACVYPGAADLQSYWHNILSKTDAVIDVPPRRWDADLYYSEKADDINKVYCKRGGYLDEFMNFDPVQYGVMPLGVEGGEPDQFLVLQVVHGALKDAGYLDRQVDNQRTEFILGRGNYLGVGASNLIQRSIVTQQTLQILKNLHPELTQEELAEIRRELLGNLPKFSADSAPAFIPNLTTGRVANRLDFMGPNFTVDAACASSLIATEIGVQDLLTGKCDLAITGGVHIFANVPFLLIFCAFQAMSLRSQIRPFDKDADGTLPGEGAGVVILKRLADAQRDGDRIYAVIKGIGVSSDGRAVSVVAPRLEGEELALRRAYENAGLSPRTIRMIEAHGVGTSVGDVIEVQAMRRVFGDRDESGPRCALGTVKSMIGHSMPAAGVAGLIKAALALYHKVLPPTIHCTTVNPKLEIEKTPFYLNTETRPWIHGEKEFPRRAGVNAFGFGGINAHVILEEYVGGEKRSQNSGVRIQNKNSSSPDSCLLTPDFCFQDSTPCFWETETCIFSGNTRPELVQQIESIQKFLGQYPRTQLRDLAYSLNTQLGDEPCRLAVVASCADDLMKKMAYARQRLADPECRQIKDLQGIYFFDAPVSKGGKLAFLFPGEGAQYVNMLADLCIYFPEVRSCFDRTDRILLEQGQKDLPSYNIFAPPFFSEEERIEAENRLWRMDRATEAVLTSNLAMHTLLGNLGIKPDQMVGHSAGEWSAMVFSGIIDADEFLHNTGRLNQIYRKLSLDPDIPRATLIAVGAGLAQINPILEQFKGKMYVADDNCPHQLVITGEEGAAEEFIGRLRARAIPFEKLPFDRGYHTPLFAPICPPLEEYFSSFSLSAPRTEIYSCTTASPYPTKAHEILELAVKTWIMPVAFRQTIENMYNSGTRIFIEAGPRGNLTAFVEDILRGKPHLAIPSNVMRRSGITQLNHLIGLLSAQRIPLNLPYLYQYRSPQPVFFSDGEHREKPRGVELKIPLGLYSLSVKERKIKKAPQNPLPIEAGSPCGRRGRVEVEAEFQDQIPSLQAPSPPVMQHYFQTMSNFLDTQKEMMQAYLERKAVASGQWPVVSEEGPGVRSQESGARRVASGQWPVVSEEGPDVGGQRSGAGAAPKGQAQGPAPTDHIQTGQGQESHLNRHFPETGSPGGSGSPVTEDADQQPKQSSSMTEEELTRIMLDLVSEKTGYPKEMIDLDLDMEGDLGIDSIKRVEIVGSFRSQYAQLGEEDVERISGLKTIRQVIDYLKKKIEAPADSPSMEPVPVEPRDDSGSDRILPFVGTIIDLKPGKSVTVVRQIDLREDLFLDDHRFGQKISEFDASLGALPVVPMTVSIEIMAEVASLLFPGQELVRVDRVAASQWICLEREEAVTLRIRAEAVAPGEAMVQIFNSVKGTPPPDADQKPVISGRVFFAAQYPSPPPVREFVLQNERTASHTAEQVYSEHRMFHGPRFQGIVSLDSVGENGLKARLETLPRAGLFRSGPQPDFLTDPFLLDAAGQLVGYWPVEYLDSGFVIFPIALESLRLYGPPPAPGSRLQTLMRLREVTATQVRADLDLLTGDGRLVVQLIGWEDWRFYWSRELYDFWRFPHRGFVGRLLEPKAGVTAESRKPPVYSLIQQFWRGEADVFRHVMAYMVLSRREREIYHQMPSARQQGEWLLGRMVAKDAIRGFLQASFDRHFYPADVSIIDAEQEKPELEGEWMRQVPVIPSFSLAYTDNAAIAVAAEGGRLTAGISIDLSPQIASGKQIRLPEESFESIFSPEEKTILSGLDRNGQAEVAIRFRCAKEAVIKALGRRGQNGDLWRSIIISAFDFPTGEVKVSLGEDLRKEFPGLGMNPIQVYTIQEKEYIIATTIFEGFHNG